MTHPNPAKRKSIPRTISDNVLDAIDSFCKGHAGKERSGRKGRKKTVSPRTAANRREVLLASFRQLIELNYDIQNPYNLNSRHIEALVGKWVGSGTSVQTLSKKLSVIRIFAVWLGKGGLVHQTRDVLGKLGLEERPSTAGVAPKSSSPDSVPIYELLTKLQVKDPRVAVQLELMLWFDMSVADAASFTPLTEIQLDGQQVALAHPAGRRGGKPRLIPVEYKEQSAVLDRARHLAETGNGAVGSSGKTREQKIARLKNVLTLLGVTRSKLGYTAGDLSGLLLEQKREREQRYRQVGEKVVAQLARAADLAVRQLGACPNEITPGEAGALLDQVIRQLVEIRASLQSDGSD